MTSCCLYDCIPTYTTASATDHTIILPTTTTTTTIITTATSTTTTTTLLLLWCERIQVFSLALIHTHACTRVTVAARKKVLNKRVSSSDGGQARVWWPRFNYHMI